MKGCVRAHQGKRSMKRLVAGSGFFLSTLSFCAGPLDEKRYLAREVHELLVATATYEMLAECRKLKVAKVVARDVQKEMPERVKSAVRATKEEADLDETFSDRIMRKRKKRLHVLKPGAVSLKNEPDDRIRVDLEFPADGADKRRAYDSRRETLEKLCLLDPKSEVWQEKKIEVQKLYSYFCEECGPISRKFSSEKAHDAHYTLHRSLITEWGCSRLGAKEPMWWCSVVNGGCGIVLHSHRAVVAHIALIHEHLPVCQDCKTVFDSEEAHDCPL